MFMEIPHEILYQGLLLCFPVIFFEHHGSVIQALNEIWELIFINDLPENMREVEHDGLQTENKRHPLVISMILLLIFIRICTHTRMRRL